MHNRFRTMISLTSIMAALSVVAVVAVSQLRRPAAAEASPPLGIEAKSSEGAPAGFGLNTFRDIARSASPAVVNINTEKIVQRQAIPDAFRDLFGDGWFGPHNGRSEKQKVTSLGSGFVIDAAGYILTNRHVIEGADEIKVTLPNRKTYDAKLVGKDRRTDVALIKIEPRGELTVLPLGDSDKAEAGEWVMAIGSPFNMRGTVTVGVISFIGRPLWLEESRTTQVEMIQTDAAINPGNSGGPLLNTRGEAIGINTLIVTQGVGQSAGVGFAVPINVARGILPQLKEKGSVTRGWIGVVVQNMTEELAPTFGLEEATGAVVTRVVPAGPAGKAGLLPEDVIVAADGTKIEDSNDLVDYISSRAPDTVVKLRVLRGKEQKALAVTLGTFPEEGAEAEGDEAQASHLGMAYTDLTAGIASRLDLPPDTKGVVVTAVEPGEAADDAGLRRGDVVVSVNSQAVESVSEFEKTIDAARSAGAARLRVRRGNSAMLVVIKLE